MEEEANEAAQAHAQKYEGPIKAGGVSHHAIAECR